ncbi:hypothetical protein ENUP19_0121G0059 [Entamoeba nuttalli]|uniref:Aspartate aminotransferase, putative n=2 Tax=Entamoeba nuttalli TaxID=412467 RepID=K2GV60_ENTNP|nr:aspartate aminotransferase, putative [Entamoeba nuttalli P19]EKE38983.1 aspartate aminotransferase, putative [Entamoeba nuttalli P19]|eukprot:XP_008858676.1 aspartate aminotransferase, putative [Entamoeba nuttalli P19]
MFSKYIEQECLGGTMIRRMSNLAHSLKAKKGNEKVIDLTLGNPQLPPPNAYINALKTIASTEEPLCHGYSSTNGDFEARKAIACIIDQFEEVQVTSEDIIMTSGCAGACNVFLKTILDPGDEVIIFSPYFVEYIFYIQNYGGIAIEVPTRFEDKWQINKQLFEQKLSNKTRCVIFNSPNNPTGVSYTQESIDCILNIIREYSIKINRPIWVLNDAVYCRVVEPNIHIHSIFHYRYSAIAYSLSKDVSIPGERIGCLAVNPNIPNHNQIVNALATTNEILGFVHTNKLQMRIIPLIQYATVDINLYNKSRQLMCQCLDDLRIQYIRPEGTFFIFPKVEASLDEWEFCRTFAENGIVTVPGSGFGCKGFYRISVCQTPEYIQSIIPKFKEAFNKTVNQLYKKRTIK